MVEKTDFEGLLRGLSDPEALGSVASFSLGLKLTFLSCETMKVHTSGVYGELVLRSATTWPSGPFLVLVMFSLCRTLDMMQNDTVTSGNDMFFVLF